MADNSLMQINNVVTNTAAFTTPTGIHFRAGSRFTINLVGERNARCHAEQCGSVVWFDINEGVFVTAR